jgi:protein arginine kinase
MMFLPALTEGGKIKSLVKEVSKLGLTVRGAYGEGSEAEGFVYQISNEVTLGVTEHQIISEVSSTVEKILLAEQDEMKRLYTGKNELAVMDKVWRSFGILTHSVLLEYGDFLKHISWVKLGAMLKVIPIEDTYKLDSLIVSVRPANLCVKNGKRLTSTERDLLRAQIVADKLKRLRGF